MNAYDDGRKVYGEFSSGIMQGGMAPLVVVCRDSKPELVNSRAHGNVLIVDRLFAAAELRLGGESHQIVRIVRTDGRRNDDPSVDVGFRTLDDRSALRAAIGGTTRHPSVAQRADWWAGAGPDLVCGAVL